MALSPSPNSPSWLLPSPYLIQCIQCMTCIDMSHLPILEFGLDSPSRRSFLFRPGRCEEVLGIVWRSEPSRGRQTTSGDLAGHGTVVLMGWWIDMNSHIQKLPTGCEMKGFWWPAHWWMSLFRLRSCGWSLRTKDFPWLTFSSRRSRARRCGSANLSPWLEETSWWLQYGYEQIP